jgi:malonyl CoA-acyl carrier protein transacylase
MNTPSDVTLPAGVARVNDWEPDGDQAHCRFIVGVTPTLTDHPIGVSVHAFQWSDGTLDDGEILSPPGIAIHNVDAVGPLDSEQARELAAALLEAAAEFDSWVADRTAAAQVPPPMFVGC